MSTQAERYKELVGGGISLGYTTGLLTAAPFTFGTTAIAAALLVGAKFALGGLKSQQQKDAEYYLSRSTNEIEAAMDLNRFAVMTGLVSYDGFLLNYDYLWSALVFVSQEVGKFSPDQGRRSLADRDYGGQFAQVWRYQFRDEVIEDYQQHPERWTNGYRVRAWWWDWPERSKFTETDPSRFLGGLPAELGATAAGPTLEGEARRAVTGSGLGKAALFAGGGWLALKLLRIF